MRQVLAATLDRCAQSFDSVAQSVRSISQPRGEVVRLAQIRTDAGFAIHKAAQSCFMQIPDIAEIVAEVHYWHGPVNDAFEQRTEVDQLFLDVMRWVYSFEKDLLPYCAFIKEHDEAIKTRKSDTDPYGVEWRRHEIEEWATGCRILAEVVRSSGDKYRSPNFKDELNTLSKAGQRFARDCSKLKWSRTMSDDQQTIWSQVYRLRCFWDGGKLPVDAEDAFTRFTVSLEPDYEDFQTALVAVQDLVRWSDLNQVSDQRSPNTEQSSKPENSGSKGSANSTIPRGVSLLEAARIMADPDQTDRVDAENVKSHLAVGNWWSSEPIPDLAKAASSKRRFGKGCFYRDHLWLYWNERFHLSAERILCDWNSLSDEERRKLVPEGNSAALEPTSRKAVEGGIKMARGERETSIPSISEV